MRRLLALIPALLLAAVVLLNTTAAVEWVTIRWVLIGYVLFCGVGALIQGVALETIDLESLCYLYIPYLLLAGLLAAVLATQEQGLSDPARGAKLFIVLCLVVVLLGARHEMWQFLQKSGVYLAAYAVLLGTFLYHAAALRPGSGLATFPLLAGLTMGLNVFVFPRFVSRDTFLWLVSLLAAVPIALGLRAYSVGPYEIGSAVVDLRGVWRLPVVGRELRVMESVFANPNTLGVLAFAGTFAAVAAAYRSYKYGNLPLVWVFPLTLGLVNSVGLVLSHSRASYLAFAVALGFYALSVLLGRDVIPYAFLLMVSLVGLFLLGMNLPIMGINPSNRFTLWSASIRAILDNPSFFGSGIVDPSDPIAQYLRESLRGTSPHNSYLSVFLRVGLLGGAAYLVLTVGSIVDGLVHKDRVDVSMLAFAVGFGYHQLFEAYSLFAFSAAAMVGAIATGYLILDGTLPGDRPNTETTTG